MIKQRVISTVNEVIDDPVDPLFAQMREDEAASKKAIEEGVPALRRLFELCETRDSGQIASVACLLAGLYNSPAYPFPMNKLRGLDSSIHSDCLAVIRLDSNAPLQAVQEYFDDGNRRFQFVFKKFGIESV